MVENGFANSARKNIYSGWNTDNFLDYFPIKMVNQDLVSAKRIHYWQLQSNNNCNTYWSNLLQMSEYMAVLMTERNMS